MDTGLTATGSAAVALPVPAVTWTGCELITSWLPMRHSNVYVPVPRVAVRGADVPGPSVSISPAIAPEASTRVISPARPDWLVTVNVRVPGPAAAQSRAHPARVTVTPAAAWLAGSAATVVAATR